jgi:serine protease AprX
VGLLGKVTGELLAVLQLDPHTPVRVIVRGDPDLLTAAATRHNVTVLRVLGNFVVVSANAKDVEALAQETAVETMSLDRPVVSAMALTDTTVGAGKVRAGTLGYPGVTGRGIGVAVLDSGIAQHDALASKVVAAVSFVPDDANTDDRFGHGTHIAGIIAGRPAPARGVTTEYRGGIAPGAHLINVRVLGDTGLGLTSNVIAGLEWVVANRTRYNIRVVNLSLGQTITGPCAVDPLCRSVQWAVQRGVIVVASAGNRGKSPDGHAVLGTVTSPGNSPFAITVGALNMWGTADRGDDTVTTYSSRGPTAFDFLIKPDVVAPGNKIVSLEADGGFLATQYSALHVGGSGSNGYTRMSGTSMAAGVVSGGVALLAEAVPGLTFAHAKLLLQSTASLMPKEGLTASGAGSVDFWTARRLAASSWTTTVPTSLIGRLLAKAGAVPFWDLAQRYLAPAIGSSAANQIMWGDALYDVGGQQILWGDQIMWGDGVYDSEGQQILWGDQIMWGDMSNDPEGEQILWGDQIMWGE